jgi:hypothetical protein
MEPILFHVEDISEYIVTLLLITLYSNVKEICLYQSVAKVITWAPTLADSALLHLCIDFVLFFLVSWKKPTNDGEQSALFSIFLSNIYYASEGCYSSMLCANTWTFREKRTIACASINFFLSLWLSPVTQTTYCIIVKE